MDPSGTIAVAMLCEWLGPQEDDFERLVIKYVALQALTIQRAY
jgi:hypothetical protein